VNALVRGDQQHKGSRWKRVPLGAVVEFMYGKSLPKGTRQDGAVPVYGSNGIAGVHSTALVQEPTVIVGRKGSAGAIQLVNEPCYPIDTTYYTRIRPGYQCDVRFLAFALRTLNLGRLKTSTGVPGLNREDAYRELIPLPPMDEQIAIVDLLSRAENIVRMRREAEQKAKEIIPALFLDMFGDPATNPKGWDEVAISEVASIIVPTRDKPKSFSGDIPWITIPDLKFPYTATASHLLSHAEAKEVGNRLMPAGCVLLSCAASLGKVSITAGPAYANQQLYGFVVRPGIMTSEFLTASLLVRGEAFFRALAGTSTLGFFSKAKALSIRTSVPPFNLQERFAARVRDLWTLQIAHLSAGTLAEQTFQSVLAGVFGEATT
jgi:type I restriction enzyme S subunit